ncbi:DUF4126 domain-containing protein [Burkholderiaceae bacterium FT117]|uniref:DUF4126 domain-containing protein n=1 Tax=Zeimonas sediminis TaxID=2944268 RepID=UPI002343155B|nr:DUF4126 domain-containing protein [Zeimonas sediminis]MCM5569365.1 DUF4126 domain-containing protein [Zeimonas sediminis]
MLPLLPEVALAAALAWGAGIRLYAVVFLLGLAHTLGWWSLPAHLEVLAHPLVIGAAAFMAAVELFADKLPLLDTIWDGLHTFVRIPAGAALAAAVFGDAGTAAAVAAALLGGSLTATTHLAKSGTRAAVNTSPEPFSNLLVSSAEDLLVPAGLWLALGSPLVFLGVLLVFLALAFFAIRLLVRGLRRLARPASRAGPPAA